VSGKNADMVDLQSAPSYADLPELDGEKCAWDFFGRDDDLGTLNWLASERVLSTARSARSGQVINLDLQVDFGTRLSKVRQPMSHVIVDMSLGTDDYVDGFYLQSSSQWDGFRHIKYRSHGYYGGHQRDEFETSDVIGIGAWAARGIVGRGLLIDVGSWAMAEGVEWSPATRTIITTQMLNAALDWQGSSTQPGDILLIRTGWLAWLRGQAVDADVGFVGGMACVGLDPASEMAEWLWNRQVAAVAADNPALEALPMTREDGLLHRRILTLLGMPIGEYWDLDELADTCARNGRYDGLLVSHPLYIPRAVGSPSNAVMIL
jgi:kynurenine formamidase